MKIILLCLGLVLSLNLFAQHQGTLRERGTDRMITYTVEKQKAVFRLIEGDSEVDQFVIRAKLGQEGKDIVIDPNRLGLEKNLRSKKITEGYEDVTVLLAETMNIGMLILFPITGAVYGGYSLSYLYTLPRDMLSTENIAFRKFEKLVMGKNIKAKPSVFENVASRLFRDR